MKKRHFTLFVLSLILLNISGLNAQIGKWNPNLAEDSKEALQEMLEKNPKLKSYVEDSYGYAIFPRITKAGIGIGGAAGNGVVWEKKVIVGSAKLKQASVGFQFGGQQYREAIFFKDKEAFERFTNGQLKFDAQASAVAISDGVSIDAAYQDGVAVFTSTRGGLMYEASVGGQHFQYKEGTDFLKSSKKKRKN
ncbi:MAG: hypothetical protein KJO50_05680 [Bacteroidia bacterium]|nr:hypothetical protein [Bacteroidia bacterium]